MSYELHKIDWQLNTTTGNSGSSATPTRDAMIQQFFNTAVFANPNSLPRGFYGAVGRNIIRVMKDVVMREAVRLQFRGDFFPPRTR